MTHWNVMEELKAWNDKSFACSHQMQQKCPASLRDLQLINWWLVENVGSFDGFRSNKSNLDTINHYMDETWTIVKFGRHLSELIKFESDDRDQAGLSFPIPYAWKATRSCSTADMHSQTTMSQTLCICYLLIHTCMLVSCVAISHITLKEVSQLSVRSVGTPSRLFYLPAE